MPASSKRKGHLIQRLETALDHKQALVRDKVGFETLRAIQTSLDLSTKTAERPDADVDLSQPLFGNWGRALLKGYIAFNEEDANILDRTGSVPTEFLRWRTHVELDINPEEQKRKTSTRMTDGTEMTSVPVPRRVKERVEKVVPAKLAQEGDTPGGGAVPVAMRNLSGGGLACRTEVLDGAGQARTRGRHTWRWSGTSRNAELDWRRVGLPHRSY